MVSFPYYSHTIPIRIPKDLGIVWEAYHKQVPCHWGSLEIPLIKLILKYLQKIPWVHRRSLESIRKIPWVHRFFWFCTNFTAGIMVDSIHCKAWMRMYIKKYPTCCILKMLQITCDSVIYGYEMIWWVQILTSLVFSQLVACASTYVIDTCLSLLFVFITKSFRYPKCRNPKKKTLSGYFGGLGFPLHKPYPYSLYRFSDSSILGTWNVWWFHSRPSQDRLQQHHLTSHGCISFVKSSRALLWKITNPRNSEKGPFQNER